MRTPRSQRRTLTLSERTTSSWRGSFPDCAAIRSARAPGVTSASRTSLPSLFETTFCANASTSPSTSLSPARVSASRSKPTRSSPGRTSGMPWTGTIASERVTPRDLGPFRAWPRARSARPEAAEDAPQAWRPGERTTQGAQQLRVDHQRTAPEAAAMVVLAEADRFAAIVVAQQLDRRLAPLADGGGLFDDLPPAPGHREGSRKLA